ncbi:MAG TPA: thioredoxin family protein [Mucilaginibacter sp.]|jgi:thioredoxin-related protein|nr:thioredoxin family protein [Mucilaginibacter sp.]
MKLIAIAFITFFSTNVNWLGDFDAAKTQAVQQHKLIMVNFSGSDWCGPCIRLRKEILESAAFEAYAADHLVLVRADFPRQKKNQLSKEQVKLNEALADKYNSEGKFPYTLLVDDTGKVLFQWDGFPDETPDQFVGQIDEIVQAKKGS